MVKIKELLHQALRLSYQETNPSIGEVRYSIKIALNKLDIISNKKIKKLQNHTQWWDKIKDGTKTLATHTAEGHVKTLKQLNDMIKQEENKIQSIEEEEKNSQLLNE